MIKSPYKCNVKANKKKYQLVNMANAVEPQMQYQLLCMQFDMY